MKFKQLCERPKTCAVIFDIDDEPISGLREFALTQKLSGSYFTAIGAFRRVTLGYFDWQSKEYKHIKIEEQVEVLSLIGNIAMADGEPKVHAHVVLGKRDGTAHGGHLLSASVRPTLEVVITETPKELQRKHDESTGLTLIDLS